MHRADEFDFDYFDNPQGLGYRGYYCRQPGDLTIRPWETAAELCSAKQVGSVIDLGCAKGFLIEALIKRGITALGYDISEYALAFAVGLPCIKRDIRDGISGSADAIIAIGVLMYLDEEELQPCLREIRRACNRLFICMNFYEGDVQVVPDPLRRITRRREWWKRQIQATGFRIRGQEGHLDLYVPV